MKSAWRVLTGILGIVLTIGVNGYYASTGYRAAMPFLLVIAVAAICIALQRGPVSARSALPGRADLIAAVALVVMMAPLYWWRLHSTPWQVNSDEVTIMLVAKRILAVPKPDLFGISYVFGFPSAVFIFAGRMAELLGGVGLHVSRIVHGTLGMGCVLLAYGLFRQVMQPLRAGTLAVILGANHALFAISRMAMRENTGLFLELLALWLLARGVQKRSRVEIFLAGVSTGIAFYAYFPARIALVIVIALMVVTPLLNPRRDMVKRAALYAALVAIGWAVVAAPVMIASRKNADLAFTYARQQFLIYPEGRKLEMDWTGEKTPSGAWKANIRNGLAMFNSRMHDQGYIYPNYKHGFVDPVTGVLLWIGFILASVRVIRQRRELLAETEGARGAFADVSAIVGFLGIYLSCAFLITKAPNYTRLLVVLPFVAWFAGTAVWWIADRVTRRFSGTDAPSRAVIRTAIACGLVMVIAVWNLAIFRDFASLGHKEGNDIGSTGRYVEARMNAPGYTWVLAADKAHPYFSWGEAWQWKDWVGFFAGPSQTMQVASVADLSTLAVAGNFTVLLTNIAWQEAETGFRAKYPLYEVKWLTPDARLLAIDVRGTR